MSDNHSSISSIVGMFFQHGVIRVDSKNLFVLSSGARAPIYIDHRRAFTAPRLRKLLVSAWAEVLESKLLDLNFRPRDVVCVGTATAGIAPAMALAAHWECEFLYVRQKPKDHGLSQMVEGEFDPQKPHLVIDDMLTTGQSLLKSVDALRHLNTKIVLTSTITTHAISAAHQTLSQWKLPYQSLFETQQILNCAHELGLISQADVRCVLTWLEELSARNMSRNE